MTGCKTLPIAIRASHIVLHVITIGLIIVGIYSIPKKVKNLPELEAAKFRATVWLVLELLYITISAVVFAISVRISHNKNLHCRLCGPCTWIFKNFEHVNIFYYSTMSMFVLYGCMAGCHIPYLFLHTEISNVTLPVKQWRKKHPDDKLLWHCILIAAVIVSAINALMYFWAAFVHLEKQTSSEDDLQRSTLQNETNEIEKDAADLIENENDNQDNQLTAPTEIGGDPLRTSNDVGGSEPRRTRTSNESGK